MKLERLVFGWTGDARWMDEYERTLFNCRLGTQNAAGAEAILLPARRGILAGVQLAGRIVLVLHGHRRRRIREVR